MLCTLRISFLLKNKILTKLDDTIYAVGGQDGVSCLSFVEKYDIQTNRWSRVASMSTRRLGVAVCVLDSKLYAIGGSDGVSPLSSVERYDPKTNRWTPVAAMLTRRKHLGCVVYNNQIYAVGGRDDMTELNTAERYNPQLNQWQAVTPMKSRRSGVGLAVVNGKIYAIGGFDGSTYLKTVEVYDPETMSWKLSGSMIYRRLGGGVGVVKVQKDSVLFKSPVKASAVDSKGSVTSPILGVAIQQQQHEIVDAGSSSSVVSVQNQGASWPYAINGLPSLLANVPAPSNLAGSTGSDEFINAMGNSSIPGTSSGSNTNSTASANTSSSNKLVDF